MSQSFFRVPSFLVLVFVLFTGCGSQQTTGDPSFDLHDPDTLTLFSLDGRDPDTIRSTTGPVQSVPIGKFYGYPVLGKVEVLDSGSRKRLIAALGDGIRRRPDKGEKCFWPRHGLRAVENGKTIEYVICFQCSSFDEYVGGEKVRGSYINKDVQAPFDKQLEEAGIPLAPK